MRRTSSSALLLCLSAVLLGPLAARGDAIPWQSSVSAGVLTIAAASDIHTAQGLASWLIPGFPEPDAAHWTFQRATILLGPASASVSFTFPDATGEPIFFAQVSQTLTSASGDVIAQGNALFGTGSGGCSAILAGGFTCADGGGVSGKTLRFDASLPAFLLQPLTYAVDWFGFAPPDAAPESLRFDGLLSVSARYAAVPEPGTAVLVASCLAGAGVALRTRRRRDT